MTRIRSIAISVGTLCLALTIGFVMQETSSDPTRELEFDGFTPTASARVPDTPILELPAAVLAATEMPAKKKPAEPEAQIQLASAEDILLDQPAPAVEPAEEVAEAAPSCTIAMTATPAPAAMIDLSLSAPCHAGQSVTFHHSGMMFDATTDTEGALALSIPALSETAVIIAAFDDGEGAVSQASVPSLPFYDRVVVQWQGAPQFELHAREFGAAYWTDGHIWRDHPGNAIAASQGDSGFLTRLGDTAGTGQRFAEIYSYPAGTTRREGQIALTVEAQITDQNCNSKIEAQTLELREGGLLKTQDLVVDMPECSATGDFLVLKNMLEDLKIALN
jgi:hypothetical protein